MFENTQIEFVENHKHLGLTLSNTGKWNCHIDNIAKTSSKILGIMRQLKYTLSRAALNQIYISYVLPVLEYSSVVWDGCSDYNTNTLEKIQHEAARIVTGLTRSVSIEKLFTECGWTTLTNRRIQQKMTFMYKVSNQLVPSYISDIIPPLVSDVSNYPLRNSSNYSVPYTRTEVSRRSCVPSSVSLWNNLDETVRNSSTINSFKNNVKSVYSNLQIVPPYYIKGDRKLSVIHARLRNNCSNLKHDLYTNFVEPDFSCRCGYSCEDANHYFFVCSLYLNERVELFHSTVSYHPLSLRTLLFGDQNLSTEDNFIIFRAVHRFIKETKRFDI